ncbi:MAG: hypothetical protein CM15mV12_0160 [uncultured marine virus]|nr:MAG: hypothetical protein CM15mV12_0160 [uncultured marine virus]
MPYGFVEQTGGVVKLMKSSYSIKLQDNRPPIASFPEGIFVNDYEYKEVKINHILMKIMEDFVLLQNIQMELMHTLLQLIQLVLTLLVILHNIEDHSFLI